MLQTKGCLCLYKKLPFNSLTIMCLHDYIKFNNNLCSPYIYLTHTFQNNVCFVLGIFLFENCKHLYFPMILVGIRLHRSGQF